MARRLLSDARAIITGTSSGIGRALAGELARRGARLVLNARRSDKLGELAAELIAAGAPAANVVPCPGDVSDPAARQKLIQAARSHFGGLDVLINNAGIGALGRFADAAPERLRRIMEVNFFAAAELIRLALPLLKAGNRPLIVNVGSILGHRGIPRSSEYCASKFALQGFSESLRAELAPVGVDLLVVSPGTTESDFHQNVIERLGEANWPAQPPISAEAVARAAANAMEKGKREIIPNARGRLLCLVNRLAPRLVDRFMARYA